MKSLFGRQQTRKAATLEGDGKNAYIPVRLRRQVSFEVLERDRRLKNIEPGLRLHWSTGEPCPDEACLTLTLSRH